MKFDVYVIDVLIVIEMWLCCEVLGKGVFFNLWGWLCEEFDILDLLVLVWIWVIKGWVYLVMCKLFYVVEYVEKDVEKGLICDLGDLIIVFVIVIIIDFDFEVVVFGDKFDDCEEWFDVYWVFELCCIVSWVWVEVIGYCCFFSL